MKALFLAVALIVMSTPAQSETVKWQLDASADGAFGCKLQRLSRPTRSIAGTFQPNGACTVHMDAAEFQSTYEMCNLMGMAQFNGTSTTCDHHVTPANGSDPDLVKFTAYVAGPSKVVPSPRIYCTWICLLK